MLKKLDRWTINGQKTFFGTLFASNSKHRQSACPISSASVSIQARRGHEPPLRSAPVDGCVGMPVAYRKGVRGAKFDYAFPL
jgi:hypothetical protein